MKSPVIKAFVFLTAVSMLCACKGGVKNDSSLQITKNDVIHLDGTFEENFMDSWEYILLEDGSNESIVPGTVLQVRYDDGLYFIRSYKAHFDSFKVFDSTGH